MSEPPVEYIELNLCNHDEHDVSQLNEWGIWAVEEIERLESEVALREEAAERLAAIKAELITALEEAVYDIASWGEYADYYFQEKWDLSGDISKIEAAIEKAKRPTTGGEQAHGKKTFTTGE